MTKIRGVFKGKTFYTYSSEDVVWFYDPDHSPYTSRKEAELKVEVRSPMKGDHVSIAMHETTKDANGQERTRVISTSLSKAEFAEIVAHVNRTKDEV